MIKKIINGIVYYDLNGLLIAESEVQRLDAICDTIAKEGNRRRDVEHMTDEDVLQYIKSRDPNREVFDTRDLELNSETIELIAPGKYKLLIFSSGDLDKTTVALCRAGFSRYKSVDYAFIVECYGSLCVASGDDLTILEEWSKRLSDNGVRSALKFSD